MLAVEKNRLESALRGLYPNLTEQELKEAEENLARYMAVALEIVTECLEHGQRVEIDNDAANLKMEERSNVSFEK